MTNCLFCKILKGDIPSEKVYENEKVYGFKDIAPMAKEHYLFVHKNHTSNVNELVHEHPEQLTDIFAAIRIFTKQIDIEKSGFRIVTNIGSNAGQTVFHTHFHVLGGERLGKFGP